MKVADYFAEFSVKIDRGSFAKADKELASLEARLNGLGGGNKGFSLSNFSVKQSKLEAELLKGLEITSAKLAFDINKFDVNQAKLNIALGTALDIASTRNTFQISRFHIDQSHLNTALIAAMKEATLLASKASTLRPNAHVNPMGSANDGTIRPRHIAAAGGIAGGLSRVYGPALALGLGGYGLAELNQRNQQVVSAQLQSQAVVQQAGGTAQQGTQSFEYLRKEANRIGFNYLDASGDYNKLLSGLTGSGVSVGESQKVFSGFAELARVNKLDKTTQNRLFRALSQVAGKGKLQSEELVGQISEALPGGTALFAQAYQEQLKATGKGKGDLTGQAAIQALLADMKKGKVTSEILTYAGASASARANAGGAFDKATEASQAEQQRYQNSVSDLAVIASNAGVEEGFARIFRTLNAGLSESGDLVKDLAEGFNEATKWADDLLLWPQSFSRALNGKDSLVADWLGKDQTAQLISDWTQIKALWADINSVQAPSWLPTLEATSKELKSLLDAIARLKGTSDQASGIIKEEYQKDPSVWGNIKGVAKANWFTFSNTVDALNPMDMDQAKKNWGGWLGVDSWKNPENVSPTQFDSPESQRQFALDSAAAAQEDGIRARMSMSLDRGEGAPGYGMGQMFSTEQAQGIFPDYSKGGQFNNYQSPMFDPITTDSGEKNAWQPQTPLEIADYNKSLAMSQAEASTTSNKVINNFDISINVDATLAGIEIEAQAQAAAQAFSTALTGAFDQAQVNWPTK